MIKLYNEIDGVLYYWETWDNGKVHIVHYGTVGSDGISETILKNKLEDIIKLQTKLKQDGYLEYPIEKMDILIIEYSIDGFGSKEDIDKRHKLEELMNSALGWMGLGNCDGGSIGDNTMEICCYVVNFDTAKKAIEYILHETEFSDYKNIYCERRYSNKKLWKLPPQLQIPIDTNDTDQLEVMRGNKLLPYIKSICDYFALIKSSQARDGIVFLVQDIKSNDCVEKIMRYGLSSSDDYIRDISKKYLGTQIGLFNKIKSFFNK